MQSGRRGNRASPTIGFAIVGLIAVVGVAAVLVTSWDPGPAQPPEDAARAGAWSTAASLPTSRSEIAAAVVGEVIIAVGGLDQGGRSLDAVGGYNPVDDAWTQLASMPEPRDHAAAASWEGRLYVSGGGDFAGRAAQANLWAYDPEPDAWSTLSPMPRARWQHAMVAIDGVLYVLGGLVSGSHDPAVWAYDIAADTWRTDLAPMPTPRDHLAAVVLDGRIVALGGRMGGNLTTVEIYDPSTDTWTVGPEMPTPRSGFAAARLADGIHVTGGEDFGTGQTIPAHERLDAEAMTWAALPDVPTARHGVGSGVVGGRWYVVAGGRAVGLSTSDILEVWIPVP